MASQLSCHIECSLCLSDFTDPVTLSCEHSYCRQCITGHMQGNPVQNSCPECRKPFTERDLRPSRLLRNMTDAVREHLSSFSQSSPTEAPGDALECAEHDEKLKLFCETDQELVCVVCRDGENHKEHRFKPVKEAAQIVKEVLKGAIGFLAGEIIELGDITQKQEAKVTETKMISKSLSAQISAQFEELHQFLRKKEEDIKKELEADEENAHKSMSENLTVINDVLKEEKEMQSSFQAALEIHQPDHFLQWWNEKGFPVTEKTKQKDDLEPKTRYSSKVKGLSVVDPSLFLGPHETHLQFFVWKEMLETIKSVPETFTIQDPADSYLKVAPGGAGVRQATRKSNLYKDYSPGVVSTESFSDGQHYWEVEVGKKLDWSVGVKAETDSGVHLHLRHGKGFTLSFNGEEEFPADVKGTPSKIGIYLDCQRKYIYFYDANAMSQIFICRYNEDLPWFASLYPGLYLDGTNSDALTVCSYRTK